RRTCPAPARPPGRAPPSPRPARRRARPARRPRPGPGLPPAPRRPAPARPGCARRKPLRARATPRACAVSLSGTVARALQPEQLEHVAHQLDFLVRLAEVALDADLHGALAVLLAGTRGDHDDRHVAHA